MSRNQQALKWADFSSAIVVPRNPRSSIARRICVLTKWRNNILASIATTGSKTRMRPKDIKIHFIYGVIRGHARLWYLSSLHSMVLDRHPVKPTQVHHTIHAAIVVKNSPITHNQTGNDASSIWRQCINSVNATTQRNSSAQTISVNTWSIVMPERVGNGPIFSKMHAWKKSSRQSLEIRVVVLVLDPIPVRKRILAL